tara:strand:- start:604 stop:741 length:138 start_codon:yes stop_codon:yes gene_type:complete
MTQSATEGCKESSTPQHPHHQTSSDTKISSSEIEKLYQKIKEDWL